VLVFLGSEASPGGPQWKGRRHNTEAQGNAVEGNAVEGNAVEGNAVEGNAVEGNAVEGNAVEGKAAEKQMQCGAIFQVNNKARDSTVPRGAAARVKFGVRLKPRGY
jgi:hypothetical protein